MTPTLDLGSRIAAAISLIALTVAALGAAMVPAQTDRPTPGSAYVGALA